MHKILNLIITLFTTSCLLDIKTHLPRDHASHLKKNIQFDIIIVGAGAAGCVLANKLSENKNMRILIIEAGDYPPSNSEVPGLFFSTFKTKIDWSYENEPSPLSCLGYENQRCTTASGKVLGGSTTINGMIYTRALAETFDSWSNMGNEGWDSESLQKYYKLFEGSVVNSDNYEKKGPLTLSPTRTEYGQIRELLMNASKELGISWRSGNEKFGIVECYSTIRDRRRCSAAKAYLAPIKLRPNLFLSLNTLATKILFSGKVATGIKVKIRNKYINIAAKYEVIISGGTIETPKLLMLSGIGPKAHLKSLGIPLKIDLPVGKNLHDHFLVAGNIATIQKSNQDVNYINAALEYCVHKEGLLAVTNAYNIQWFINTKNNTNQSNVAIQFFYIPRDVTGVMASTFKSIVNFNEATIKSLRDAAHKFDVLQFGSILTSPASRGEILLKSKNPNDKPRIFGNYLSDKSDADVNTFLETMEYINRFLNTSTMRKYNVNLYKMDIPNCRGIQFNTHDYWRCFIRNLGTPSYHPVGTCKMAPPGDPSGVVTPDLKLIGLDRIRVIDASIMPKIIDRNLMSAVNIIAHKGADMIIGDLINKI